MPWRIDLADPWRALSRAPMVRLTIPMLIGIWGYGEMGSNLVVSVTAFLLTTAITGAMLLGPVTYERRWVRGVAVFIWMLVFGWWWAGLRDPGASPRSISHHVDGTGPWMVRTTTINRITPSQLRADAQVIARWDGNAWHPSKGKIMLTLLRRDDPHHPVVGDRYLVDAPMKGIRRIADPGGFDRQVWAAARGIEMELFAVWDDWVRLDHTTTWLDRFSGLRKHLSEWVDAAGLDVRERALVKALVLGQRDELDSEQRTSFARSGTIHVLAVSGMHVGLIYMILGWMLGWLGGRPSIRVLKGVLVLLALWTYAGITGGAPSIVRASMMFSFMTLADMTARRADTLNSLFAAMFVLLLWDPMMIRIIGFQLSFLAVLGIVLFHRPIELNWTPANWFLRKIWSLAVLSVSAQLLTAPVSLLYFKAFPVWFLPANLVVVSAVIISVWAAIAMIGFHWVPLIGDVIVLVLTVLLKIVSAVTGFFASLPYAYPVFRIDTAMVIMLYVIILSSAAFFTLKWKSMRSVFSVASVMLLLLWAGKARSVNRTGAFTLYDEREHLVAGMNLGRAYTVLRTSSDALDHAYFQRKVEQHRKVAGLMPPEILDDQQLMAGEMMIAGNTVIGQGIWSNGYLNVLFMDDDGPSMDDDTMPSIDVVVLHGIEEITAELLARCAGIARMIVLSGRHSYRDRSFAAEWCETNGIALHDIFAQGAFIRTFELH